MQDDRENPPSQVAASITTAVSLFALLFGIGGLYRLDAYHNSRAETLGTENWIAIYGPPHWALLTLVTLMALLAISLAWRKPRSSGATLLGLYVALVSVGYGLVLTASSSPLFEFFLKTARPLIQLDVDRGIVRLIGNTVTAIERSLWLAGWAFAGSVCIHFCTHLLNIPRKERQTSIEVATILASWTFIGALLPASSAIRLSSLLLVVAGLATVVFPVRQPERIRKNKLPLVASAVILLQLWLSTWGENEPVLGMVAGALILLVVMPRLVSSNLLLAYIPALLLGVFGTLTVQNLDYLIGLVFVWLGVCIVSVGTLIFASFRALPLDSSRQALWLLSGFLIAGFCAITWKLLSMWGDGGECVESSTTALCMLYRYSEWLFVSPLLVILGFSVVALQYQGHVDAARFFRRTTVYGTLAVISIFSFGALEAWLERFLGDGLPSGTPPVIAAGTLAVALHPAKKLCDRLVNPLLSRLLGWVENVSR